MTTTSRQLEATAFPPFRYDALPMRINFGPGSLRQAGDEMDRLGLSRALVVCTPEQEVLADKVLSAITSRGVGVFNRARMHVPIDTVHEATGYADDLGCDSCVVVGGGSSIGLGKAIALERGLPIVAIPTTYAGSEMTPVWGITREGLKTTGRNIATLPVSVIYDPSLTTTLPGAISAASGLNAVAHAAEALYAPDASPIVSLMAEEGVRALVGALPTVVADGGDLQARSAALYGAWLCGACLGATTMSLHHKLCHVLGGSLNLPHAQTHAILLPYTLAYNEGHAPMARAALSRALKTTAPPSGALWELTQRLPIPKSLAELGVTTDQLTTVVKQALINPYANPAPVTAQGITTVLEFALRGERPEPSG